MTLYKGEVDSPAAAERSDESRTDSVHRKAEGQYNLILHAVGSPGRFQIFLLFLLGLGILSATVNDFVSIFYATPPKAIYCIIPEHHVSSRIIPDCLFWLSNNSNNYYNNNVNNTSLRPAQGKVDYWYAELDQDYCRITPPGANLTDNAAELNACRGWPCPYDVQHNFSYSREWTVISQWGLSCDAYWLFTLSLVLYFTGALVGTLLFDLLTRRLGCKSNLWVWFVMSIVLCVGFGFEKSFWLFVLMRFLLGVCGNGIRYACTRLMFDLLPSEQRVGVAAAVALFSGVGLMVVGFLAFFIMDWRFILYGTLGFSFVGLSFKWAVPESLRHLLATSQTLQAQQVFFKLLAKNKQFLFGGVDVTVANASASLVKARQSEQPWRIVLRSADSARPFIALLVLCLVCNVANYGVMLSVPHLGGSIYLNVVLSGFLEICGIFFSFFLIKKMSFCRIFFVTVFLGGLLFLTGGLIPGGLPKTGTVEVTRTALLLVGRASVATGSAYFLEMFLRVLPSECRQAAFGLHGGVAMIGAIVGSMFNHMGRLDMQIPFLMFGILCVSCAFLAFALPVDDFMEKPTLDSQDITQTHSQADSQADIQADIQDEEELVFEALPEMNRSPYVL